MRDPAEAEADAAQAEDEAVAARLTDDPALLPPQPTPPRPPKPPKKRGPSYAAHVVLGLLLAIGFGGGLFGQCGQDAPAAPGAPPSGSVVPTGTRP